MPPPPQPPQPPARHSRTNLGDLKSLIEKRLGPERARRYFSYLNGLLSQKLSKPDFNKLCLLTVGRENLPLHNHLIRSILKNACRDKIPPPPVHDEGTPKPAGAVPKKSPQTDESFNSSPAVNPPASIWSNGDILSPSPRKFRSVIRDRKIKDRPSPVGPNGRLEVAAHQFSVPPDEDSVQENGDLNSCYLKRPLRDQQGGPAEQPARRPRTEKKPSPLDQDSVYSKGLAEVFFVDRRDDPNPARGPLQAPLGIPFCPASVGGARRPLPPAASGFSSIYDCGELYHTEVLKKRMEKIAGAEGLGGVMMDSANLLNIGLDAYLKQLIKSCAELAGARKGHEPIKQLVWKQQPHGKPINGVWLRDHMQAQSIGGDRLESTHGLKNHCAVSLPDFKVAMELNPQQLGEDWPLLLEKICLRSCEE